MNEGWILITRKLLSWQWFDKSEMVHLWLYLLLTANIKPKKWHGMTIERGQVVVSVKGISEHLRLSVWQVRNGLERLKETGEITTKTTNKYTVVTICNYCGYQDYIPTNPQTNHNQTTIKPQTNHNQTTIKPQQLNKETSKQGNNETRYIEILGANAPLSPSGDGVSDTPPEIPENGEKTDAADNTLTLTPPQPKKEKSCAKKEKDNAIDFDALKEFFNNTMQGRGIHQITSITGKRQQAVAARAREHGKNAIATVIENAAKSKFLNAETPENFLADFNWLFRPENFVKVLEGKYTNRERAPMQPRPAKLSGAGAALQAYETLTQMYEQNGNNTDNTSTGSTTDAAVDYLAALGNF